MKKLIDDRGRIRGKISVIDLAFIAVCIALVLIAYLKFGGGGVTQSQAGLSDVRYTITIKNIRPQVAGTLRAGDAVKTQTGASVGTVAEVRVLPATSVQKKIDGSFVEGTIEGKVDCEVVISAKCTSSGGRYFVDRTYELALGRNEPLVTKYTMIYFAQITDIVLP
ncbi:MAG: DUF4330 domain-containing protein [Oscillospiraceae bacterium]|jgi:hypothetical protein|nr:DUF4330 domain-containing protein [Oscillospiraceae bacterium]